jgi:hypothetical protein
MICGGGLTAMLVSHRSTEPIWGNLSLRAWFALFAVLLVSLTAARVALLPAHKLDRLVALLTVWRVQLGQPPRRDPRWVGVVLCATAVMAYGVLASHVARENTVPSADQGEYLRVAREIQRDGGLLRLAQGLWTGRFREANRHPAYLALLAVAPEFHWGKWLSALAAASTIALVASAVARRDGWLVAGLATVLLATNHAFLRAAGSVACETLLVFWVAAAWGALCAADEACTRSVTNARPPAAIGRRSARLFAVAGGCLGGAYLTKASGFLLLAGAIVWVLTRPRLRHASVLLAVGFALTAAPLLWRNGQAFGNPLYSFNTRFLFEDSFEAGLQRPPEPAGVAARRYFAEHSAVQVAGRLGRGLGWESYILFRVLSPAGCGPARALVGAAIAAAALASCWTGRAGFRLAALWTATFVFFFGWYVPIAAGDRFLLPLLPCLLHAAALAAVRLIVGTADSMAACRVRWLLVLGWAWVLLVIALGLLCPWDGAEFS